jgi:DNA-binding NtrC family response regulator
MVDRKQRILLVDDEAFVRRQVTRLLQRAGYEVWEADNAHLALELSTRLTVDLVITDLYMPRMNGFAFIETLVHRHNRCPVIAMTGGGARTPLDLLADAARIGADQVLQKPFQMQTLLEAIRRVLGDRAAAGPLSTQSPQGALA